MSQLPVALTVLPRLFPVLMTPQQAEAKGGDTLALRHLAVGLAVALVEDDGRVLRYLTWSDLQEWGADFMELLPQAVDNLRRRPARLSRIDDKATGRALLAGLSGDEGWEAAHLLAPDSVAHLTGLVGEPCAFALPERNTVFAFAAANPKFVAGVKQEAAAQLGRSKMPLTTRLYRFERGRLTLLE